MGKKNLYIIAGCNGAGKTTASFNILPEILSCQEFVNADEIARGISPFNPEKVALEAGRLMLNRINELTEIGEDFAFETTLATKSHQNRIIEARKKGYYITLIFYWLDSPDLAKRRVALRVKEGGHNIPADVIERRYFAGIKNLFNLYLPICDYTLLYDNSLTFPVLIMENELNGDATIHDLNKLEEVKAFCDEK